jgi:hypothetical protein
LTNIIPGTFPAFFDATIYEVWLPVREYLPIESRKIQRICGAVF